MPFYLYDLAPVKGIAVIDLEVESNSFVYGGCPNLLPLPKAEQRILGNVQLATGSSVPARGKMGDTRSPTFF